MIPTAMTRPTRLRQQFQNPVRSQGRLTAGSRAPTRCHLFPTCSRPRSRPRRCSAPPSHPPHGSPVPGSWLREHAGTLLPHEHCAIQPAQDWAQRPPPLHGSPPTALSNPRKLAQGVRTRRHVCRPARDRAGRTATRVLLRPRRGRGGRGE